MRTFFIFVFIAITGSSYSQDGYFNTIGVTKRVYRTSDTPELLDSGSGSSLSSDSLEFVADQIDLSYSPTANQVVETIQDNTLNLVNLYREMERVGLKAKLYVMAQAILETGFFSSSVCHSYNNIFGLYDSRKKDYYRFDRWEDSVDAYYKHIQYRYKGGDYLEFLNKIGYAEDPKYTVKVNRIYNRIVNAISGN